MKNTYVSRGMMVAAAWMTAGAVFAAEPIKLDTSKDKASYAIGVNIGNSIQRSFSTNDLNLELLVRGLQDRFAGTNTVIPDAESTPAIMAYQNEVMARKAEGNKKIGAAFLAENAKKEGVKTTPSGLQYKVLTPGTGPVPGSGDTVSVNYRGTLIDGTEFDSSYKRNQPATFQVTQVIKGWTEALTNMPVGSKWQLFIPADIAYGDRPAGPLIQPGSTLIFEVELLSTKAPEPPKPAEPVTGDVIRVPSQEEMKKGAKIETIKAEDFKKMEEEARKKEQEKSGKK
jgi:FKBP-type peptidyl-prolyl cis-trans isomerase FklB